ncbi:MAG: hypothetical protein AAF581_03410 [Planctomycetota bacterium]
MQRTAVAAPRGLFQRALLIAGVAITSSFALPGFTQEAYGPPSLEDQANPNKPQLRRNDGGKVRPGQRPNRPKPKRLVIPEGMQGPVSFVEVRDHDWGTILQGTAYEYTFQIENKGDMVLKITNVKPG